MVFSETFRLYKDYNLRRDLFLIENNEYINIPDDWEEGLKFESKISESFKTEYINNVEQKTYFFGCPFSIYKHHYEHRLKTFLKKYPDANDIEFIESELRIGIYTHEYPYVDNETDTSIYYSLKKRIKFLEDKTHSLGYSFEVCFNEVTGMTIDFSKIDIQDQIKTVNWLGTQIEFMELIKALIENGTLKGKQKDIIERSSKFFNIVINNPSKTITDFQKRINGNETLFINKLEASLLSFINREIER